MANLFKIKEIARSKKISIKNLAETVGISEQGLQKLIRDNSTKVETLESIAKGLNVSIGVFFEDENQSSISIAAEPGQEYQGNTKKYIQKLEDENKRLFADNERKQELLDNFLSGSIVIAKKETEYVESLHRISELEHELKEIYKSKVNRLGDMDGGLENAEIVKSKKGA